MNNFKRHNQDSFNWDEDKIDKVQVNDNTTTGPQKVRQRKGCFKFFANNWVLRNIPKAGRFMIQKIAVFILCLLPGFLDIIIHKVVTNSKILNGFPTTSYTTVGGFSLMFWSLFVGIAYLSFYACQLIVGILPGILLRIINFSYDYIPPAAQLYVDYLRDLRGYVSTLVYIVVLEISFYIIFRPDQHTNPEDQWRTAVQNIISSLLALSVFMTVQKFMVQIIATKFHRQAYMERIRQVNYESQIINYLHLEARKILREKQAVMTSLHHERLKQNLANRQNKHFRGAKDDAEVSGRTLNESAANAFLRPPLSEVKRANSLTGMFRKQVSFDGGRVVGDRSSADPFLPQQGAEQQQQLQQQAELDVLNGKAAEDPIKQSTAEDNQILNESTWHSATTNSPGHRHNSKSITSIGDLQDEVSVSTDSLAKENHGARAFLKLAKDIGKGITNVKDAGRVAKKIFDGLCWETTEYIALHSRRPYKYQIPNDADQSQIHLNCFLSLFKTQEEAERAFLIFDRDFTGTISKQELKDAVVGMYKERKELSSSLRDVGSAVGKLDNVLVIMVVLLACMTALLIFGVPIGSYLLTSISVLFAATFVFGNSARNMFEGIIFLFVTHPYDVGDRVFIDNNNYIVKELGILYTVLEKWDGQVIYSPNSVLATKDITNVRRSPNQIETVEVHLAYDTSAELIQTFRQKLNEYVQTESKDFMPKIDLVPFEIEAMNKIKYYIYLEHRNNWQDSGRRWQRHAKFMNFLRETLITLGIVYHPMQQPIHVQKMTEEARQEIINMAREK
ncbi:hypothetical protein MIR68_004234 [Amoeboaphelidium protococcarum]|nr:hypothetical protein MIR68_004234 [Amoeboaphelidium protococcarum]